MSEAQITKIVTRLATRPKWSIETRRNIADVLLMEDLEAEYRFSLARNHESLERIDLLLGILEGIGKLIIKSKEQEAIQLGI